MNSTRRNATSTRLRHFYVVIVFILIRFRPSLLLYTMGAFHSTKTFENLETPANGTEFPRKKFFSRNSESCCISEMRTIQPKILQIPGAKLNGKKISWKNHQSCPLFLKTLKNAISFVTGSCRKLRPDVLVEWIAPICMGSIRPLSRAVGTAG